MPSICGKSVQNTGKLHSKTCQYLSTVLPNSQIRTQIACVQQEVIRRLIPVYPRHESTSKLALSPLLIHSYTHNPHPLLLTLRRKN